MFFFFFLCRNRSKKNSFVKIAVREWIEQQLVNYCISYFTKTFDFNSEKYFYNNSTGIFSKIMPMEVFFEFFNLTLKYTALHSTDIRINDACVSFDITLK